MFTGNVVRQPMTKGISMVTRDEGYPNADAVMERGVLLPLHHGLTDEMFERFHQVVNQFIQEFTYQNITEISEKEILYLESRINEVDKELNVSRERLIFFLEENKNYQNSPTLLLLYNELNSELIFKEGVMTTLLQQIEIAKLNKVNIAPVIGVLDLPQIAAKKSSPSRLFFLLFGFIVGMLYQSIAVIIKSLNSNDF